MQLVPFQLILTKTDFESPPTIQPCLGPGRRRVKLERHSAHTFLRQRPFRLSTVHFRLAQERGAAVVGRGAWVAAATAPTSGAGSSKIRGALDQRCSHLWCIFPTNSARSQKTLRQEFFACMFAFLSPHMQVEVAVGDLPRLGRNDPTRKRTELWHSRVVRRKFWFLTAKVCAARRTHSCGSALFDFQLSTFDCSGARRISNTFG